VNEVRLDKKENLLMLLKRIKLKENEVMTDQEERLVVLVSRENQE
jgi:hypothetical protein